MPSQKTSRAALLFGAAVLCLPTAVQAQDVRVTVVTVLATDKNTDVDPKLKDLKREVMSREPTLTGYRIGKTGHRDINVGQKQAIKLFDDKDYSTDVTLVAKDDTRKRVTIEVKAPLVGAIRYDTVYDKFFPIVTPAVVDGERLIIAYMVKPAGKTGKPAGP
ncbi:MAG TPA: hypothetical protein VH120_16905 [Gemmataceae bacterium]|nr:hypothetical protein [Gemmataceae bacterium]